MSILREIAAEIVRELATQCDRLMEGDDWKGPGKALRLAASRLESEEVPLSDYLIGRATERLENRRANEVRRAEQVASCDHEWYATPQGVPALGAGGGVYCFKCRTNKGIFELPEGTKIVWLSPKTTGE